MAWTWATLMPHPPIIIPAIGKGRELEAQRTLDGLDKLVNNVKKLCAQPKTTPEYLLVVSPHQPYTQNALFINNAPHTTGSLAPFGAPQISIATTTPQHVLSKLVTHLQMNNIPIAVAPSANNTKDHGSIVPLYYLQQCFAKEQLPPIIFANPIGLTPPQALNLGKALRTFCCSQKGAFIASGDLSHKLHPSAPAGYSPAGAVFDKYIIEALSHGKVERLTSLTAALYQEAGECGMRSVIALLGLTQQPVEVLSYEGPFGVGYCTGLWQAKETPVADAPFTTFSIDSYPKLARATLRTFLGNQHASLNLLASHALAQQNLSWQQPAACFVSIKSRQGALRGCMGTFIPTQPSLAQEIMSNAMLAGTKDPRFPPIILEELDNLVISVDVLNPPQPVKSIDELDPAHWGVIVTKDGKRGLLLPDLEGVTTVEQQLTIATQKANLSSWDGAEIVKFSISRHKE